MPTEPRLKMLRRHDADLALAGGDDARAVRPDQARLRARERALDRDHVELTGMPSVMQTISGISASIASQMASAAPGGGT